MEITLLLFFLGLSMLVFLIGKYYSEMREAGPFLSGFMLLLLSVLVFTGGIQYRTGEVCLEACANARVCLVSDYTYESVGDIERISSAGVLLATGLILFLTGYQDRRKRIEETL